MNPWNYSALSWNCYLGFLSVAVVYPDVLTRPSKRALKKDIRSLSKRSNLNKRLFVHLYSHPEHIPPPYNSLLNLARFFSPSSDTVLLHSTSSNSLASLQAMILEQDLSATDRAVSILIPGVSATELPGASAQNGLFNPRSALLLNRDEGPWCPERFISQSGDQWIECLWQAWVLSLGNLQVFAFPETDQKVKREDFIADAQTTTILVRLGTTLFFPLF